MSCLYCLASSHTPTFLDFPEWPNFEFDGKPVGPGNHSVMRACERVGRPDQRPSIRRPRPNGFVGLLGL